MDENNVAVLAILDNQCTPSASPYKPNMAMPSYNQAHTMSTIAAHEEVEPSETNKQNVIWTKNATLMLLSLYETKMHVMDNPKKKTKMWKSIAEELRSLNVEDRSLWRSLGRPISSSLTAEMMMFFFYIMLQVTPDQVRWKINALTKKYKDCIENGQGQMSFKYFNEMHQILGRFSDDSATYRLASGVMPNQEESDRDPSSFNKKRKTNAPFRNLRLEQRAKIQLDKQWVEYLRRQEEQKLVRDERYERSLRIREEELQLRRKELELKQALAFKRLQLKEKKQEEILRIEREKCELLRKLLGDP